MADSVCRDRSDAVDTKGAKKEERRRSTDPDFVRVEPDFLEDET